MESAIYPHCLKSTNRLNSKTQILPNLRNYELRITNYELVFHPNSLAGSAISLPEEIAPTVSLILLQVGTLILVVT